MNKIKIGIAGYGNLGKGAEAAVLKSPDMELCVVFSRRTSTVTESGVAVCGLQKLADWESKLDVVLLCGGSATDLPEQGPLFAKHFNTVDSFDTHAKIPEYFDAIDSAARASKHFSIISAGWDPGLFSAMRVINEAVLPQGEHYTFWGPGVSQGHSDAVRRIDGVINAKQYTIPCQTALSSARSGENPTLTARQRHNRVCYVVAEDAADKEKITQQIVSMPNYFADYDTQVNFIDIQEFNQNHLGMAHGGFVLRGGETADGAKHVIEYSLKLASNPMFTSSALTAYARAAVKMAELGHTGAVSVLDIPPAFLSFKSGEELRASLL